MQINPTIRTLSDVPRLHAQLRGAKPALIFDGRTITYAELYRRSRQVAQGLVDAGIGHGDRIAYLGKNTSDYFELLFGAALIGAVITPINWRLAEDEVAWIVRHAEARAWFYQSEFASRLANVAKTATGVRLKLAIEAGDKDEYAAWRNGNQLIDEAERVSPDDVAVQVYTSGTTGRPKGAMLRHRNLLVFRALPPERQPVWNRWSDDDVSLITMPVFHIGCTGFGLQTLCAGSTGFIESEFDADRVMHCIEHERLSKLFVVPTALQSLLRHPRARDMDYGRIRTIIYGASPISSELLREAMEVFRCGFVQQYGMTEMTGTICALTPEDHDAAIGDENANDGSDAARRLTSAGRALDDVQIVILDEAGNRLAPGQVGEIAILSPTAMAGYWRDPEATAAVLDEQGWFRSGDAGYFDEQGFLYVSDRVKDMIVSGGENIYPAEIERVLAAHPSVLEVAVIGVPSDRWGEEVKALVVLKPGETADAEALAAHSRRFLAGFKTPKSIEFVPALTRSGAGKVLRRVMREPYWAGRARRIG